MPAAKLHVLRSLAMRNIYSWKDEDVEFFRQKFAGSQSDRIEKVEAEAKIAEKLKSTKISEGNAKKQKVKSIGAAKPKPSEAEISVSRLDIRVGLIKKVQKHPDADIRLPYRFIGSNTLSFAAYGQAAGTRANAQPHPEPSSIAQPDQLESPHMIGSSVGTWI
ncbi:uncharacterized protein A4U43_C06F13490 [Asparagus officinalis]|uniref:Uncharacterized protein n=1 Tax=Asparagus officinalis TaxID=4686 RepID=A0A5P1EQS9_ASPOF|nr:uncharacterized protein A4U43_C06F13490 [Asparagus officinalis]